MALPASFPRALPWALAFRPFGAVGGREDRDVWNKTGSKIESLRGKPFAHPGPDVLYTWQKRHRMILARSHRVSEMLPGRLPRRVWRRFGAGRRLEGESRPRRPGRQTGAPPPGSEARRRLFLPVPLTPDAATSPRLSCPPPRGCHCWQASSGTSVFRPVNGLLTTRLLFKDNRPPGCGLGGRGTPARLLRRARRSSLNKGLGDV